MKENFLLLVISLETSLYTNRYYQDNIANTFGQIKVNCIPCYAAKIEIMHNRNMGSNQEIYLFLDDGSCSYFTPVQFTELCYRCKFYNNLFFFKIV